MEPSSYALCQAAKWLKSSVERPSEKGFEQPSEGGTGRHTGPRTGPTVPLRWPVTPRFGRLRDFSDGLYP